MIKKEIYPKTKRVSCKGDKVYLTEKIDGSNLVFFKKDDKLYFAQRNNIICIDEIEEQKVAELVNLPNKEQLDSIYEKYTNKVNRNVEGFVINYKNIISKYVRMKNGQLREHFDRGE
jgi:hypothetical protein